MDVCDGILGHTILEAYGFIHLGGTRSNWAKQKTPVNLFVGLKRLLLSCTINSAKLDSFLNCVNNFDLCV